VFQLCDTHSISETEVRRLPQGSLNYDLVRRRLRRTRKDRDLSLREVAAETELSAATLSRFEKGVGNPDLPTLTALADWLGLDHANVFNAPTAEAESTPDVVEVHLRADPKLDPRTAEALARSFRQLYDTFTEDAPKTRVRRRPRQR
jgi:transcriptional regulator with XRE-family HTH domain